MCGIIGYVGKRENAKDVILDGLAKLEYRGYDSAGIAIIKDDKIFVAKKEGKLKNLRNYLEQDDLKSHIGIGHTRWATHGVPSDKNSHPHISYDKRVAVVHNGIIENYIEIRKELEIDGIGFNSDTDSEVVAHLFARFYNGDMIKTLQMITKKLRGSYALGILDIDNPNNLVCARKESPLIIGVGENENFIASDIPAILKYTRSVIFMGNDEYAKLSENGVKIYDKNGNIIEKEIHTIAWDDKKASKNGYDHFMLKEIEEDPQVVVDTINRYVNGYDINLGFDDIDFNKFTNITIVGCGTAYHAGLSGAYFLKKIAKIWASTDIASEFRYSEPNVNDKTLAIFISQSGETLDTLMAMKLAKSMGATTLAITNVLGSTISREADIVLYTMAGPEISVASTKAYIGQVVVMYLLANYIAKIKGDTEYLRENIEHLEMLPYHIQKVIDSKERIKKVADNIYNLKNGFFIGRGIDSDLARESSLKMKEVTYIHTEALPAGELKHGTIALIEEDTLVVAIATDTKMIEKIMSNIKEIKARGGYVVGLTTIGHEMMEEICDTVIYVDEMDELLDSILAIVPMQILAYYTAIAKGLDVDKPRNLAKSVTVE